MSSLVLTSPQEYFRDLLGEAIQKQRVAVLPDTEFYLVNLLADFLKTDRLFTEQTDGSKEQEPLALMLARSVDAPRDQQIKTLRRLGDVSLYVSGFFSDSLEKKVVDVDYYAQMGMTAYSRVAVLSRATHAANLFEQLSRQFHAFVDVLGEVAERTGVATNTSVLRLYEKWMKTGSVRLARKLGEQGVVAQVASPKLKQ
jgi:hypothetical protein